MTPIQARAAALIEFDANGLPRFIGDTYEDHVTTFRCLYAATTQLFWALAAICASLERSGGGGSPRHQGARRATRIQRFCADVGVNRQTFQRLSRTYRVFATGTTTGTCALPGLSFTHYEVAGRLSDDPIAAVTEAHEKGWSANELGRQLEARKGTKPAFLLDERIAALRAFLRSEVERWPVDTRTVAQALLHTQVDEVFEDLDDDLAASTRPPKRLWREERHAVCWIKADLEHFPFVQHTFNEVARGRGGDLEIVAGSAGCRIYHEIVGQVSTASRARVLAATESLLDGKITKVGRLVFGVACRLAARDARVVRLMELPPSAGGDVAGTLFEPNLFHADDDLRDCLPAPDTTVGEAVLA